MPSLFLFRTLVGALLLSCLSFSVSTLAQLQVAASTWPPYVDENAERRGAATVIVEEALKRAGYDLNMVVDIWPRSLEGTRSGVYDVIAAAWYSDERNKELAFSKPFLKNNLKFVVVKNRGLKYDQLEDLNGKMIGTIIDYAYGEPFDSASLAIRAPANHTIQNLRRLTLGQIDMVLADEQEALYLIRTLLPDQANNLEILPRAISTNGLHIAVSREHPQHQEILKAFNAEIETMNADGSLKKILQDYGM
ncbi:transporter substrate-binding domain-containing protein [Aestuariirhabdus sp. Z084]|uniref:substrate-binding periplasmic protein n=1 Tax=Aestuariirhabdus haliotis TaxID=2918751 RepID=UPI00201B4102|nr:transporter substrate-binding domain-containing protein [Aestuariirhabdus haliotis]MCL6416536.1 transporter substrate-binding domain-containing protein [Aestuariirhabdus haliotis]MCL6420526.1 transporter substrate-binding domain-containing protein [Aestuariirhabdus haliotis]